MPTYVKVVFCVLSVVLLMFRSCDCAYKLNKCCKENEEFDETLRCSPVKKSDNNTAVSYRTLAIDEKYDRFKFSSNVGRIPCKGKRFIIKESSWFSLSENGILSLFNDDDIIVANYSRSSYCVESWNIGDLEPSNIAYICPCMEHLCVMKCCVTGMQMYLSKNVSNEDKSLKNVECRYYDRSKGLEDWDHSSLNGSQISVYHETVISEPECTGRYKLPLRGKYHLQEDGTIWSETDGIIQPHDYCGDYIVGGDKSDRETFLLACVEDEASLPKIIVFSIFSGLAVLFLLLTVILHLWLPELSGLHGRCLVAHASCLALGHLWTIPSQLVKIPDGHYLCFILGYLMQFTFLASFFWLNIMCVDMSYTFSAIRPTSRGTKRDKDKRKFLWYSLYAWGGSTIFTLAAIIVDFTPAVPTSSPFKPNLGAVKCWFNSTQSVLLYFYGPMGVLLVVNLFLFVYTTWRIVILSKGTDALRKADSARHGGPSNREKQRYILYTKMFSLMGVTWLTEIISWAVGGPSYFWYLTDFINLLRAVFIFIIFCWKPKVWNGVKRKYKTIKCAMVQKFGGAVTNEEHISEHSGTSTESTECTHKNAENRMEMRPGG